MKIFRNRYVLILLSVLMASALCFYIAPQVNRSQSRQTQIIRVTKTIPEGTAITQDMIQTVSVGGYNLPTNIAREPKDVIGKYTTAELDPGDYILSAKVTDKSQSPYLTDLEANKEAISISIKSFAAGLSGKLQSGDIISLIVSNYGSGKQTITPPELKYVKLLAATNSQGTDTQQVKKDDNNTDDQSKNIPATLTLLVNPQQAQKLVDYEINGSLYAALVFRGSADQARAFLDQQDKYFASQIGQGASQPDNGAAGGVQFNAK